MLVGRPHHLRTAPAARRHHVLHGQAREAATGAPAPEAPAPTPTEPPPVYVVPPDRERPGLN